MLNQISNKETTRLTYDTQKKITTQPNYTLLKKVTLTLLAFILSINFSLAQDFFSNSENLTATNHGFFENTELGKPPHDDSHRACSGPNPPFWCLENEAPAAPIDDWLFLLPLLGIAVGGYYLIKYRRETIA